MDVDTPAEGRKYLVDLAQISSVPNIRLYAQSIPGVAWHLEGGTPIEELDGPQGLLCRQARHIRRMLEEESPA